MKAVGSLRGHEARLGLFECLRRHLVGDRAFLHEQDPLRKSADEIEALLDHDDRETLVPMQADQDVEDLLHDGRLDPLGRLVEEEKLWPPAQAACPVSYTHLDVYKRQGRVEESDTVGSISRPSAVAKVVKEAPAVRRVAEHVRSSKSLRRTLKVARTKVAARTKAAERAERSKERTKVASAKSKRMRMAARRSSKDDDD